MSAHGFLTVDALAQEIRRVDGNHNMGAGALADAIMPFILAHGLRADAPTEPVGKVITIPVGHQQQAYSNIAGLDTALPVGAPVFAAPAFDLERVADVWLHVDENGVRTYSDVARPSFAPRYKAKAFLETEDPADPDFVPFSHLPSGWRVDYDAQKGYRAMPANGKILLEGEAWLPTRQAATAQAWAGYALKK